METLGGGKSLRKVSTRNLITDDRSTTGHSGRQVKNFLLLYLLCSDLNRREGDSWHCEKNETVHFLLGDWQAAEGKDYIFQP